MILKTLEEKSERAFVILEKSTNLHYIEISIHCDQNVRRSKIASELHKILLSNRIYRIHRNKFLKYKISYNTDNSTNKKI